MPDHICNGSFKRRDPKHFICYDYFPCTHPSKFLEFSTNGRKLMWLCGIHKEKGGRWQEFKIKQLDTDALWRLAETLVDYEQHYTTMINEWQADLASTQRRLRAIAARRALLSEQEVKL